MLYLPGCKTGKLYTPASLLIAERTRFVSGLVTVTIAPGMTAPLASRITPLMDASVCAIAGNTLNRRIQSKLHRHRFLIDSSTKSLQEFGEKSSKPTRRNTFQLTAKRTRRLN